MRRVKYLHHTFTVFAVGLVALATPLVALAGNGGPNGS